MDRTIRQLQLIETVRVELAYDPHRSLPETEHPATGVYIARLDPLSADGLTERDAVRALALRLRRLGGQVGPGSTPFGHAANAARLMTFDAFVDWLCERAGEPVLWEAPVPEQVLRGGVANRGRVVRRGDEVHRPTGSHAATIHELLRRVRDNGFQGAPRPLGLAVGQERLAYVDGDVPVPPFQRWWRTNRALATTAALLRQYHDSTENIELEAAQGWSSELADPSGRGEVICHNDVCPENVVYRDGVAVALLDFDYAAPGRRVYDLAQFAKMCCPLDAPRNATRVDLGVLDPFARLRLIINAYGRDVDRRELVDAIFDAVRVGDAFVTRHVERGEIGFVAMWEHQGGRERTQRRARWLDDHRAQLTQAAR